MFPMLVWNTSGGNEDGPACRWRGKRSSPNEVRWRNQRHTREPLTCWESAQRVEMSAEQAVRSCFAAFKSSGRRYGVVSDADDAVRRPARRQENTLWPSRAETDSISFTRKRSMDSSSVDCPSTANGCTKEGTSKRGLVAQNCRRRRAPERDNDQKQTLPVRGPPKPAGQRANAFFHKPLCEQKARTSKMTSAKLFVSFVDPRTGGEDSTLIVKCAVTDSFATVLKEWEAKYVAKTGRSVIPEFELGMVDAGGRKLKLSRSVADIIEVWSYFWCRKCVHSGLFRMVKTARSALWPARSKLPYHHLQKMFQ